jgi:hypothetical protein
MAKELPYFKFEPSEWLNGDIFLEEPEVQGIFINICCLYWHKLGDLKLSRLKKQFRNYIDTVEYLHKEEYISVGEDDVVTVKFLEEQLHEREDVVEKRRAAGKASAEARKKKKLTSVEQVLNKDLTKFNNIEKSRVEESRVEESIYYFDGFWNLYDKKRGDKTKVEKKWDKLTEEVKRDIMEYIPKYKQAQPDKQYRKDPMTFLNNCGWEDELIFKEGQTQGSSLNDW